MRKRWLIIGLATGLLAAAITGGVVFAGGLGGDGWGKGNHENRVEALAGKVAGILGTDEQATADALTQAQQELREEAKEASLQDFAGRISETLGTDADATAGAIRQVSDEMSGEALEGWLQGAVESGKITEEQAAEIRDHKEERGWHGKGKVFALKDDEVLDEFADRVGSILGVAGDDVAAATQQAMNDIAAEALETRLQQAVDSGRITEEQAAEIRAQVESGDWKGFGKRHRGHHHGYHGKHAGKEFSERGRWHHQGNGDIDSSSGVSGDVDSSSY